MMKKIRCIFLFTCLLVLALGQPANAVLAASAYAKKKPPQTFQVWFSRWPTSSICIPGAQEVQFAVSTPNGKYSGIAFQFGTKLGSFDTFTYDSDIGIGSFRYYPNKEGTENLTVTATKGSVKAKDQVSFLNDNCEYKVIIKGLYEINSADAKVYASLDGSGSFTKDPDTGDPTGSGTASLAEDLTTDSKVAKCKLTPSIDLSFSFNVVPGTLAPLQPLTPLGQAQTSGSSFTISLMFDKSTYPEVKMQCTTIEGKVLDAATLPSGEADLNSIIDVTDMYFSSEGGEKPFKFSKGSGTVTVIPVGKGN